MTTTQAIFKKKESTGIPKSCPFCGRTPEIIQEGNYFKVKCYCGCQLNLSNSARNSVQMWNRRRNLEGIKGQRRFTIVKAGNYIVKHK